MPDDNHPHPAADLPVGAVDASGEPMPVAGVTPPTLPAMVDEDGAGEINGVVTKSEGAAGEGASRE